MKNILFSLILIVFISSCANLGKINISENEKPSEDTVSAEPEPDTEKSLLPVKTRPCLSVLPFKREEDNIAAILSSAAYSCIDLNIQLTGKYDLYDKITEFTDYSAETVGSFSFKNEIDNAVYGEISIENGIYLIVYHIYETASDSVIYSDQCVLDSVLDVFDSSDEISENILSKLSDTPITFGTLDIKADKNEIQDFRILLNDIEISFSGNDIKLISGEYAFSVSDSNKQIILNKSISIRENEKTVVDIPSKGKKEKTVPAPLLAVRTIKLDGKTEDWDGIEPFFLDSSNDSRKPEGKGYDIIAGYICRDEKYLYWRMDFSDGKPIFPGTNWTDKYDLVIGNYGMPADSSYTWNYSEGYDLEVSRNNGRIVSQIWSQTKENMTQTGKYKIGPGFIEARYYLSQLNDFDHTMPVQGWMRIWRWDRGAKIPIDETEIKIFLIEAPDP